MEEQPEKQEESADVEITENDIQHILIKIAQFPMSNDVHDLANIVNSLSGLFTLIENKRKVGAPVEKDIEKMKTMYVEAKRKILEYEMTKARDKGLGGN